MDANLAQSIVLVLLENQRGGVWFGIWLKRRPQTTEGPKRREYEERVCLWNPHPPRFRRRPLLFSLLQLPSLTLRSIPFFFFHLLDRQLKDYASSDTALLDKLLRPNRLTFPASSDSRSPSPSPSPSLPVCAWPNQSQQSHHQAVVRPRAQSPPNYLCDNCTTRELKFSSSNFISTILSPCKDDALPPHFILLLCPDTLRHLHCPGTLQRTAAQRIAGLTAQASTQDQQTFRCQQQPAFATSSARAVFAFWFF